MTSSSSISLIQYAGLCPDPPLADCLPCLPTELMVRHVPYNGGTYGHPHKVENSAGGRGLCPDDVIVPHPVCAAPYHCVKYVALCCLPLQSRRLAQTYRECMTVCQPSGCLQAIWLCLFAVSFPFAENIFLFDFLFAPLLFCVPPAWLLGIHPSFSGVAVLQCVCNTFSGLF